jgi:ATP-binding cassette subfamily F protein uup
VSSADILLDAQRVSASRPGRDLFRELALTVRRGDRIGVVGINGCGKSTLLRVLTGDVEPESGSVARARGVRVVVLEQEPEFVRPAGVAEWELAAVCDRLGVSDLLDRDPATLSGGQRKRLALAAVLVDPGDVLVLDEPTNHLDLAAVAWLEERLASFPGALVMVTHDRHFLDRVCTRLVELDRGESFVHDGGYESYVAARAERERRGVVAEEVRRNLARRELEWLRRGAPARTSKPRARIEAAEALLAERPKAAARAGEGLPLHFGTPRLGDFVVELDGVGHRFADGEWLFRDVSLALDPRERLGIVGLNGAGKSTLLSVMSGRITPSAGSVRVGPTARIGVFDQHGADLDPEARVRNVVVGPHREPDWADAALMEAFWFDSDVQWAPVRLLSGGERRRLQLLVTLAQKPNVLLLDEPTNDLDLDTLRALEDFLDEWPGALVVVSHDRALLERTVADVIALDGAGRAARHPGGYAAWETEHQLRRGARRATVAPMVGPTGPAAAAAAGSGAAGPGAPGPGAAGKAGARMGRELREADKAVVAARRRHDAAVMKFDAAVAAGEVDQLAELGAAAAELGAAVDAAEERWLSLAAEAEAAGLKV